MPRGKKSSPDTVYRIMTSWAITNNVAETAAELGLSESTVRGIVNKNRDTPEFAELRAEKKRAFAERANEVIDVAFDRLIEELRDTEQRIPVNHLTTVIGTMFDKRALALGDSTENVAVEIKLPPGVNEYAE